MTGYTRAGAVAHLREQIEYQGDDETTVDTDALTLVLNALKYLEAQTEYALAYVALPDPGADYMGALSTLAEARSLQAYRKRIYPSDEYVIWTRRKAGPWERVA